MIAVAVPGRRVELLDAQALRTLATLKSPIEGPIAFSPDGKQFATAGVNSITIWDYSKSVVAANNK
jgi:WD40 repeat protein